MRQYIERVFHLKKNNTSIKKESLAGITTFMAMSYILIVQPTLMKAAGMPIESVAVATAVISAIATFAMGIYTKYPFALAPGMGTNIFFAFTLVAGGIFTWQQGMAIVFLSGLLFFIMTVFGFRETIANFLPLPIKLGIGSSVGIFLIYLGLKSAGFMVFTADGPSLGNVSSPTVLLAIIGFLFTLILQLKNITGALLLGIIFITIIGIPLGITTVPTSFFVVPPSINPVLFQLDFTGLLKPETIPFLFVFFIGDFFNTLGTLLGVSSKGGFLDEKGNLPNIEKPFLVDALSTMAGSFVGMTTVTTYVESASGVSAGGKTGLTSVFTALCFFLAIFITPVVLMIPSIATAPCLVIIGIMLLDELRHVNFGILDDTIAPLSMLTITAFTASMSNGIAIGILLYTFVKIVRGEVKEIHYGLYILCFVLLYYLIKTA
ncbi:MAG: NCS2 family permease [Desulfovibrionaceae bacterium]